MCRGRKHDKVEEYYTEHDARRKGQKLPGVFHGVPSARRAGTGRRSDRSRTLAYLAAWDVHHANLFDRVERKTGIDPFGRLVEQVMSCEPYTSARTVYWIVDNGSSHADTTSIRRLESAFENLRLIHLPIHASWLNQIELYFSIVQRKALTPNDFGSLDQLADRLVAFGERYRQVAKPFDWTFTRADLDRVLAKIEQRESDLTLAA